MSARGLVPVVAGALLTGTLLALGPAGSAEARTPATGSTTEAGLVIGTASHSVLSERTVTLTIPLRSPTLPSSAMAGYVVTVRAKVDGSASYGPARTARADAHGVARLKVSTWHGTRYRISVPETATTRPAVKTVHLTTRSILPRVTQAGLVHPRVRFPLVAPPVGAGAHVVRGPIPNAVWRSMVGVSWHRGCPVGRARLTYIRLNYWGFDGYRHRGAIVVNRRIGSVTAHALGALYAQRFRIRRIQLEDRFGRNPRGPGANDYAAMRADNTSGFNCRYVVGKEAGHVWSPHARGIAVDLNTFENPYVANTGVFPDVYWLHHRRGVGVLHAGSAAVRAFTSRGFFWGARWTHADFQHFEK